MFFHHTDLVGLWSEIRSLRLLQLLLHMLLYPACGGGWRMEAMFSAHVLHVSDLHLVVPFLSPEPFSLSLFICISSLTFAFVHIQLFEPV